jgi:nucleotide-binding universal stress UspA family protein
MIPNYKKIVLATDLALGAPVVLRHAICAARAYQATVEVLHVIPEIDQSVVNYVSVVMGRDKLAGFELEHKDVVAGELSEQLRAFAREELADHPEDLARIERIEVLHGPPASTILSEVRQRKADLLIIGTHGKGRLEYAFLGSVAHKIMRRSEVPVLLIPLTH